MNELSDVWTGISNVQVLSLMKRTRQKVSGSDIYRDIESPPLSMVLKSKYLFLQLNRTVAHNKDGKLDRIIGGGNQALFGLLRVNHCHMFVDGTFPNRILSVSRRYGSRPSNRYVFLHYYFYKFQCETELIITVVINTDYEE